MGGGECEKRKRESGTLWLLVRECHLGAELVDLVGEVVEWIGGWRLLVDGDLEILDLGFESLEFGRCVVVPEEHLGDDVDVFGCGNLNGHDTRR